MDIKMSRGAGSRFAEKKLILSAFVIVSFAIYSLTQRGASSNSSVVIAPNLSLLNSASSTGLQNTTTQAAGSINSPAQTLAVAMATPAPVSARTTTAAPTPAPAPSPTPAPAPVIIPKGQYTDGSYTGTSADAYYGTVQVQAVISGGKIVNVVFLNYPQDRRTSQQINSQAMSYLIQEAIAAQNANVDVVSGATDTSMAFQQSLASALAQAKA